MYYSESMIQMVEDLQHQASEMEKQVKDMMEIKGRALGIELDKRKNARELYHELMEHQNAKAEAEAMTWAYVPCSVCDDANVYISDAVIESYVQEANVEPHHEEVHHEEPAPVVEEPVAEEVHHEEPAPVEEHHDDVALEPAQELNANIPVGDAPAPDGNVA